MSDKFYRLGRALLDQTVRLYYRRIEVVGSGRIPLRGPAILVANHPNSVADAFLLATHLTRRRVNFIAKDSITRAPVVGWLTRQFGLVGVARATEYRGRRELAQRRNQAAINSCVPRLAAGELLAIFGEGVSSDARHLHVIRKGAMRFGYAAEEAANFQLGLVWIPVGISYSSKHHFRSQAVISVGEPFCLEKLHPDPTRHEPAVLQRGTDRIQRALESLVVHIEQDELVTLVDRVTGLFENPAAPLSHAVERQQRINRALAYFNQTEPERLRSLEHNLDLYHRQLAASGLSNDVVRQRHPLLAVRKNLVGPRPAAGVESLRMGQQLHPPLGGRVGAAGSAPAGKRPVPPGYLRRLWGLGRGGLSLPGADLAGLRLGHGPLGDTNCVDYRRALCS
jgi:1-acyl-sn-glycerol-3-phosphate acyltransferase